MTTSLDHGVALTIIGCRFFFDFLALPRGFFLCLWFFWNLRQVSPFSRFHLLTQGLDLLTDLQEGKRKQQSFEERKFRSRQSQSDREARQRNSEEMRMPRHACRLQTSQHQEWLLGDAWPLGFQGQHQHGSRSFELWPRRSLERFQSRSLHAPKVLEYQTSVDDVLRGRPLLSQLGHSPSTDRF